MSVVERTETELVALPDCLDETRNSDAKSVTEIATVCRGSIGSDLVRIPLDGAETSRRQWIQLFSKSRDPKAVSPKVLREAVQGIENLEEQEQALTNLIHWMLRTLGHQWQIDLELSLGKAEGSMHDFRITGHWPEWVHATLAHAYAATHPVLSHAMAHGAVYSYDEESLAEALARYKKGEVVTLASGWTGHSTEVTLCGEYLAYCDRSNRLKSPGVSFYRIGAPHKIDEAFLRKLVLRSRDVDGDNARQLFFQEGMHTLLGLHQLHHLELPKQQGRTCAWTSAQGGVLAVRLLECLRDNPSQFESVTLEMQQQMAKREVEYLVEMLNAFALIFETFPQAKQLFRGKSLRELGSAIAQKVHQGQVGSFGLQLDLSERGQLFLALDTLSNLSRQSFSDHIMEACSTEDAVRLLKLDENRSYVILRRSSSNTSKLTLSLYRKGSVCHNRISILEGGQYQVDRFSADGKPSKAFRTWSEFETILGRKLISL